MALSVVSTQMAILTLLAVVLLFPAIISIPLLSQPIDGTACDWNVWDDTMDVKGVQKISIQCSEGQVTWRTPFGGLSITFLPLLKSRDYELCFVAQSAFATLRILLEGNQTLTQLSVLNSSHPQLNHEICISSSADREITLFAEADSSMSSPVLGKMVLEYDVRATSVSLEDQRQECSPCSREEILLATCTADYAVVGQIHSITDDYKYGETNIHVAVNHVIRQRYKMIDRDGRTSRHFHGNSWVPRGHNDRYDAYSVRDFSKRRRNSRDTGSFHAIESMNKGYNLLITVPIKCHVKQGSGFFLFLGGLRLKKAQLQCAPRLEEFQQMWRSAVASRTNPCTLK